MNDSPSIAASACGKPRDVVNMNGMKKRPHHFWVVNSVIDVVRPLTLPGGASGRTAGSFMPCVPARRG
jgi:hypothetical protein